MREFGNARKRHFRHDDRGSPPRRHLPRRPRSVDETALIYVVGLTERLTVTLKLDCECPCELESGSNALAAKSVEEACSLNGYKQCGICSCNAGYIGDRCECSTDTDVCVNANTSTICTGEKQGRCVCGRCECNPISAAEPRELYSGQYCQCNDFACERHAGKLCGGSSRGVCRCGECYCVGGWTGKGCTCSPATDGCMARSGTECNGAGVCQCNECRCNQSQIRGPTCEDCPTCIQKCDEYSECVKCAHLSAADVGAAGPSCKMGNGSCPQIKFHNDLNSNDSTWMPDFNTVRCQARIDELCTVAFAYNYVTRELRSLKTPVCENGPEPPDYAFISAGIVFVAVAAGTPADRRLEDLRHRARSKGVCAFRRGS